MPVNLEIISGFARPVPFLKEGFWDVWPKARASDFVKFQSMAKRGHALPAGASNEKDYQKSELERSLRYCKETLGLGLKGS